MAKKRHRPLTTKQRRFVAEYLKDSNAKQAAIRAGYSAKSAEQQGSYLLSNPKVSVAIETGNQRILEKAGITAESVVEELGKIGFSDMRCFSTWGPEGVKLKASEELGDEAACISEVSETVTKEGGTIKFKLHDKVSALVALGRKFKLFTDKTELNGDLVRLLVEGMRRCKS